MSNGAHDHGVDSDVSISLWRVVAEAVAERDLDAHLSLYILRSGFGRGIADVFSDPWNAKLTDIATRSLPDQLHRPQDVACLGVRLAVGLEENRAEDFATAALRELAREPLPPAASIGDDERLLLGIAIGVGAAPSRVVEPFRAFLRRRDRHKSIHESVVALFSEALLDGSPRMSNSVARRAYRLLTEESSGVDEMSDRDRIAMYWLAARLLEADWKPSAQETAELVELVASGNRFAKLFLSQPGVRLDPLDAAFLLDAMSATPQARVLRRSHVEAILAVVDGFNASAQILANRARGRTNLLIGDEYDVQDIFFALSVPVVPDMVPEDPALKVAGKGSRIDFTSKSARAGVELKHVKSASHAEKVREELLVDRATYHVHPYLETVVSFVHDPQQFIPLSERPAFERDLSSNVNIDGRNVQFIVLVR